MALNVKNKIRLGTLFLFLLLILTGGASIYFMSKLKAESMNILRDNYKSISYGHTMQQQLNSMETSYHQSMQRFDSALNLQENNITEKGEMEITDSIRIHFNNLKAGDTTQEMIKTLQNEIQRILTLNMNAISLKNEKAQATANKALTIILFLSGLVFIISFTFLLNFPSVVTTPIKQLTAAINEIGDKNYQHRIHIQNKDEFGKLADSFNDMAEKLQYFESSNLNKLMFEKNRAEAVINSLKDASIGIDKNDIILFANQQALQLLGLKTEDVIGKSVKEISVRNDLFRFLIENENPVPFKVVVDNRENFFTKEVLEVAEGETKNKVIVLKNITSYKELDVAKTNFIATVSHELKTPLASSDFSLKLLLDERTGPLSPSQKELIENLKLGNNRMLKILSELLNMSQVESGRIQLNIQKIDPGEIIENAVQSVAVRAKEKGIKIVTEIAGNIPFIQADADKTTWVLNNFLSNAIKYSPQNSSIEISAKANDNTVIISVIDHGQGIDEQYQPRLFERYFQVPGSKEKGTGLGLAISKEFIDAQHGTIWVESAIGNGSVFSFALPVQ